MTRLFLLFMITSLTIISCKQASLSKDKDKERIDAVCDKFMQVFSEGKTAESMQLIKQNSILSSSALDSLATETDKMLAIYKTSYGKMVSFDFISEHKVKDYLARRFYILKFENYYMKFDFTLYKGSTGWTITNFNYNDELLELLY